MVEPIGVNVKELLRTAGLTQASAAELLGISQAQVSYYVTGVNPMPPEHIQTIANFLAAKATPQPIVDEENKPPVRDTMNRREYNAHIRAMEEHSKRGCVYDAGKWADYWPMPATGPEHKKRYKLVIEGYGRGGRLDYGRYQDPGNPAARKEFAHLLPPDYAPFDNPPWESDVEEIDSKYYWSSHSQQLDVNGNIAWLPIPVPYPRAKTGKAPSPNVPPCPRGFPPLGHVHMFDHDKQKWTMEPEPA